ncbi:transglycosylase domain-containing protein [Aerococcus urinaehominis]|nr:PBP1A family penicillin-binding protein [Aerococcus urinaehominis]
MAKWHIKKWLVFIILLLGFCFEGYLLVNAKMTDVENLQEQLTVTTEIYDQNNELAGTLADEHGTYVSLDQISQNLQDAVISTEDKRFYQHPGFDLIGIGRAALGFLGSGGNIVGGGSTLTQQLVKNSYLSSDQTLIRKFKELFLAMEIEKHYDKNQILEMYLNHTYFGNGVYGVEDASQKYFGKSAAELTVDEAAVLAASLKGPSIYNPVDDYDATLERRDLVLELMYNNGFIDEGTYQLAVNTQMPQMDNYIESDNYKYPYYFDAIIEEAIDKYKLDEDQLMNGGYKIYTGLNQAYQNALQGAYNQTDMFPTNPSGDPVQSASIIVDPYTGAVMAEVGGTTDHSFRGFNRATQMRRQPASAIKPLNVYTPALERGFDIFDIVPDQVKSYGADNYTPENYNFESVGEIMLWQALAQSKNTTAVWLMNEIGVNKAMSKLDDFKIPYKQEDLSLASALGGFSQGVSPMEMAGAYTAFVNDGIRSQPHFIQKITDGEGRVVVDQVEPKQNTVMSKEVADKMTAMMLAVFDTGGTGDSYEPYGFELAGKTGTSELTVGDGLSGSTDEWVMAYTPDLVMATWYGFDETSTDNYIYYGSGKTSSNAFATTMSAVLEVSPQTSFDIVSAQQLYSGGEPGSSSNPNNQDYQGSDGIIDGIINGARRLFDRFR